MINQYETAYPRFKPYLNKTDLIEVYTPSKKEKLFAKKKTSNKLNCLGLLVQLKVFQKLGFFIKFNKIPETIIEHIANTLQLKSFNKRKLSDYDRASIRNHHQKLIRGFCHVSAYNKQAESILFESALKSAQMNERLPDIINAMLEQIVKDRYELPAFSTFESLARKARTQVNKSYFDQIKTILTAEQKTLLNKLFIVESGESYSLWHQIKQEPKKPTPKKIKKFFNRHREIKTYYHQLPDLHTILPQSKYRQFRLEGLALNTNEMSKMRAAKRFTLATILIRSQYSNTLDDIAQIVIKTVQKMINSAQLKLEEYHKINQKRTDKMVLQLHDLLIAYNQEGELSERMEAIDATQPKNIDKLIDDCKDHLNCADNNYRPFMVKTYKNYRSLLYESLDLLELKSSTNDKTTEHLIRLLKSYRNSRKDTINLNEAAQKIGVRAINLAWLPEAWRKLVTGFSNKSAKVIGINRIYFELSVFELIKAELSNVDIYIEQGEEFKDHFQDFVTDEEYDEDIDDYLEQLNFPRTPKEFRELLQHQLTEKAIQVDNDFPANESVSFKNK